MSNARIAAPPTKAMSADQRALWDRIAASRFGPYGPRMILLNSPVVAAAWAAFGDALVEVQIPPRFGEIGILAVARIWNAQFAWYAHEPMALAAGVPTSAIDAIRGGEWPELQGDLATVFRYTVELFADHQVSPASYDAARRLFGDKGLVEFTAYLGHYANVAATLAAHEAALPPGVAAPLTPLKTRCFVRTGS